MNAILNVTVNGQNGDLGDPIDYDASDAAVRAWATEAVGSGSIRGIDATNANFADFVVDRYPEHDGAPARVLLRPKTPFGNACYR